MLYSATKKIPQVKEDEYFGDMYNFFVGVTLWNTLESLSTRKIFHVKNIFVTLLKVIHINIR